jgi:hypothetical protein
MPPMTIASHIGGGFGTFIEIAWVCDDDFDVAFRTAKFRAMRPGLQTLYPLSTLRALEFEL